MPTPILFVGKGQGQASINQHKGRKNSLDFHEW